MAVITYRRPVSQGIAPVGGPPSGGDDDGPRLKRKLTTILCADVAGYSRLTERDEEGTHLRLAALNCELLEPAIAARGGTLIAFGNGGSATDANDLVADCTEPPPGYRPPAST